MADGGEGRVAGAREGSAVLVDRGVPRGVLQAASMPTIDSPLSSRNRAAADLMEMAMFLLLLEALGALLLLVFIVWWTMFSGRPKGERPDTEKEEGGSPDAGREHRNGR